MPSGKSCYVYYAFDDGSFVTAKTHTSSGGTLQTFLNQTFNIPDHSDVEYENLTIKFLNNALYDNEYCYIDDVYVFVGDLWLEYDDCGAFDSSWSYSGAAISTSHCHSGSCVYLDRYSDWAIKTFDISKYNNLFLRVDLKVQDWYCQVYYFYDNEPASSLGRSTGYGNWNTYSNREFSIPDLQICGATTLSIRFNTYSGYNYNYDCTIDNIVLLGNILDTATPTASPTPFIPTTNPITAHPTITPTAVPTDIPSLQTFDPSSNPTRNPSNPTRNPTIQPTIYPTMNPTRNPTENPTLQPTIDPTRNPTNPTVNPTLQPSIDPTRNPTANPTLQPTIDPTRNPTNPTVNPTLQPSIDPTRNPTANPTLQPTIDPTMNPTIHPTVVPTKYPSNSPSTLPTSNPSNAHVHTVLSTKIISTAIQHGERAVDKDSGDDDTDSHSKTMSIVVSVVLPLMLLLCLIGVVLLFLMYRKFGNFSSGGAQQAPHASIALQSNHSSCIICCEQTANMFNDPCGHVTYCDSCVDEALRNDRTCPSCRRNIQCKRLYSAGF
eukprot:17423_1